MDSQEPTDQGAYRPQIGKNKHFFQSLGHALEGISFVLKHERNFRFQLTATVAVLLLGCLVGLASWEWLVLILACLLVLTMELVNTVIEWTIDLIVGDQYHPVAKHVKDVGAGTVLTAAIFAVAVGLIIFIPKLLSLIA
ncbi:hypothetical protein AWM75_00295 [Aerococcus urinaehominis]|uniref:UDP kinase n=2 Tax=Aerococcus urinaehominis TaxID=128944 RepID=A0A120IB33_9LACT|nr:hypothetical protein AWM75_00295 [Aerococcus urinaehominis]